jgi:hypothetical protein
MSENKPPFRALTGGFTYGITTEECEFWVFREGKWAIETLEGQSAYFALSVGGRTWQPLVRLSDVQAYQEWQAINRVAPDQDEWWSDDT